MIELATQKRWDFVIILIPLELSSMADQSIFRLPGATITVLGLLCKDNQIYPT